MLTTIHHKVSAGLTKTRGSTTPEGIFICLSITYHPRQATTKNLIPNISASIWTNCRVRMPDRRKVKMIDFEVTGLAGRLRMVAKPWFKGTDYIL